MSLLTNTVTISRLSDTTGGRRTYSQVETGVACHIEPMDAQLAQTLGYTVSKAYRGFFMPDQTIQVGDEITDEAGRTFTVKNINSYSVASGLAHIAVALEEKK